MSNQEEEYQCRMHYFLCSRRRNYISCQLLNALDTGNTILENSTCNIYHYACSTEEESL